MLTYFRPTFEGCSGSIFLKVSELLELINMRAKQPLSAIKLGILLKKLGFKSARYKSERGYLVIERNPEEIIATRRRIAAELSND